MSNHSLEIDLYTMFKEQEAFEFSVWVNSIENHVSTLRTKLCKSCDKKTLEVVSMHKAECNSCKTINEF